MKREVEDLDGRRRFLLLFASETGQAKSICEEIANFGCGHGFEADLQCVSGVDKKFSLDKEPLAIIVASTTGDGEPPETARKFWRRIKKKDLDADHFGGLKIAVLGLGDTNYTQFNNFGKSLHKRLVNLGAKDLVGPGWADDAVGLELTVEPWIENLWPSLHRELGTEGEDCQECQKLADSSGMAAETTNGASLTHSPSLSQEKALTLPPLPAEFLEIEFVDVSEDDLKKSCLHHLKNPPLVDPGQAPFESKVADFRRLTSPEAEKQKFEVCFDIPKDMKWKEGEAFGVFCPNSQQEVDYVVSRLDVCKENAEKRHYVLSKIDDESNKKKKMPEHVPVGGCSLVYALSWCCSLRSPLKKAFLQALAESCTEEEDRRRLRELCSRQGAVEYNAFVAEPGLSLCDILRAFPSCKPKPERVLEFLPRLLPRPYSAVYSSEDSKTLQFAYSLVEIPETETREDKKGICSGWITSNFGASETLGLEKMKLDDGDAKCSDFQIHLYKRKPTGFHLPKDHLTKPIVLIGPGTGVAPFLGFLARRRRELKNRDSPAAPCWLFFGCRDAKLDFIYEKDLRGFVEDGTLDVLCVAVSKSNEGFVVKKGEGEGEGSGKWKYVQDAAKHFKDDMKRLIVDEGGYIFVCGDAAGMAKDVRGTFSEILGKTSDEPPVGIVDVLVKEKRYLQDIWT